jgi:hypothetical protein
LFLFLIGFVFGWLACNWYVANDRSFDRAFGPLAQGAGDALGEATRFAREVAGDGGDGGNGGRGAGTSSAARRTRRTGSS